MRSKTLAFAGALLFMGAAACAQATRPDPATGARPTPTPRELTLADAQSLAAAINPVLLTRRAQLEASEGLSRDAHAVLYYNPQVTLDLARRSVRDPLASTERHGEGGAGVAQTFEVAGQPGHRRAAAENALRALRLEIEATRRQVEADVADRFQRVVALQQRIELERQSLRFFDDAAGAVERRRAAGEDTRLDANVALVEAERARNQLALAEEQLIEARAELAAQLQLAPAELPVAVGDLSLAPLPYTREAMVDAALRQARLQALDAREQSAQARLRLERAARYPDVTVGVSRGREGAAQSREWLSTVTVSVPLPVWRRNAAAIGQATTEAAQAAIERRTATRDVEASILATWSRLDSLRQRVERLQTRVLPTLNRNERLALLSRQAGQIGILEFIVTARQSLDARRDLIDASLDYQLARHALERVAGWQLQQGNP